MATDVVLSSAMRNNLLSLSNTQSNVDKVQYNLSTGLKVSSALDNPQNFFKAQSLKQRSSDLSSLLDGIGQSVQAIKTADKGVTSITKLVQQADSIVDQAKEALDGGGREAAIVGDKKLTGISDLTSLTGISTGDKMVFQVIGDSGTVTAASVTISTNDSIEQVVTSINDIHNSAGDQLLEASVDSDGQLKIINKTGVKAFNLKFDAASGTAGGVEDQALAEALGFGTIAKVTDAGSAAQNVSITATSGNALQSGAFYKSGSTEFASASDTLVTVQRSASQTTDYRFALGNAGSTTAAAAAMSVKIKVNDNTTQSIAITSSTTIQGLVDAINNNTTLNSQVEAKYDASTGKFSIAALDASVKTIQVGALNKSTDSAGALAVTGQAMDFDFGVDKLFQNATNATATTYSSSASVAASAAEGETFTLASAASKLSQLETDYNNVLDQIDGLVNDSQYQGNNLLAGDALTAYFNPDHSSKLEVKGEDLRYASLGLSRANFARSETITAAGTETKAALTTVRSFSGSLANSLSIIQTREDFTKDLVNSLTEGADKLTVADQNEEGAKLLALQTRQTLGVQALSLANQAQQSVLRLF